MKFTKVKNLSILAALFLGIMSFASAAHAALTVSPFALDKVGGGQNQCYARWGGTSWPDDGTSINTSRFIYCGKDIANLPPNPTQAQLQSLGATALNSYSVLPNHVKTLFTSYSHVIVIYKDFNQRFTGTPPTTGANFASYSDYIRVGPPISVLYEQSQNSPYPAYEVAFNAQHEAGHVYQGLKVAGIRLANFAPYRQLAARDFLYMDLKNPGNNYRGTYSYYLTDYGTTSNPPFGFEELFAEQFSLSPNLPGSIPGSTKAADPIIRDNFKCSQAYVNAHYQRGQSPVKSDFDALNTSTDSDVYSRCVLPYKIAACTYVLGTSSQPYPYLKSETTFFVYCGSNPSRFQTRSGDLLQSILTTPGWRQNFQFAGYSLYVFQDSAQAVSVLGSAVPTAAQGVGILGFSQPQAIGNATGPFIAMFERVKQADGTYIEHPNSNDLFNYDSGLYRETGRAVDRIAGAYGSSGAQFRARVDGDITRFNAKNGCATSGTDSSLWGTKKSTICANGAKKAPYNTMSNIQIVRQFSVADLAPAIKYPPNYTDFFPDIATATNYSLIWAEMIGFYRSSANDGNDFEALHFWLNTVYVCSKVYATGYYQNMTTPSSTCP